MRYMTPSGTYEFNPYGLNGRIVNRDGWLYIESYQLFDSNPSAPQLCVDLTLCINSDGSGTRAAHFGEYVGCEVRYRDGRWIIGSGPAYATTSGKCDLALRRVEPILPPKVRRGTEVRWYRDSWQKYTKRDGWVNA